MESMGKKPRRRRSFTPEFKAKIIELCQRGDRVGRPGRQGLRPDRDCGARVGQAGRAGHRYPRPYTLTARANLAVWAGEAGDAAGARDQHCALLPIEERVRGHSHPDTLTTRHELAY